MIVHYNVEYLISHNPEYLTAKSDTKSLLWARWSPMNIDLMRNLTANVKSKDGWLIRSQLSECVTVQSDNKSLLLVLESPENFVLGEIMRIMLNLKTDI